MSSEIEPKKHSPLTVKQWEACKGRIGVKMGEFAQFSRKTLIEMLPDIKVIKDKELWEIGGYKSFGEFCDKCLLVTRQHVYKLLQSDETGRKALEISGGLSHYLTSATPEPEQEKPQEKPQEAPAETKQVGDPPPPPRKKGGRKPKAEPEPIEAEFSEPLANTTPSVTTISQTASELPPAAKLKDLIASLPITDSTAAYKAELEMWERMIALPVACPHCGKELP